ncbi:MAG: hypothetical protein ACFFCJ_04040 [Promethearchaeota archaeon]
MVGIAPSISLSDIPNLPAKLQKKLENQGISDLSHLFLDEGKLQDAVSLAKRTHLTIREVLEARQFGRRHIERILADIKAKRKVEPFELLWKIHWLLGIIPEGEHRTELIALEASAIATILENLETPKAPMIEKLLQLLLHRLLIIPDAKLKAELQQLVEVAEKFQRSSLLAYQTTKAKEPIIAFADEEEPAKQVAQLRKITKHWQTLYKTMEERGDEKGKTILSALKAHDDLKILDISEEHLKDRLQQTMSTKKLRASQLKHITTAMNVVVELRDAYSTAKFASRASQIWFELAQDKSSKALSDDLLRSLRFSRTAIFHYRALDDLSGAIRQLDRIIILIGEIPTEPPASLEEAITGTLQTLVSTIPLLDRPADQELILRISKRIDTRLKRLMPKLEGADTRYTLATLHVKFQQIAIHQLQQLGASRDIYQTPTRELTKSLLYLLEVAPEEEKYTILKTAADYANQLLAKQTSAAQINDQDLEVISHVVHLLSQIPPETLSKSAQKLIQQSTQLNEQLYFQTKDPEIRAQLALQLLLAQVSPNSSGKISASFASKELDKLEDYASNALLAQVKKRQPVKALQAGSLLVWIILQRIQQSNDIQNKQKLMEDARDFADQTFSFMPGPDKLTGMAYPFAFLLLRNINALAFDERPTDESQWEQLLTQSEQLAQALASAAALREDHRNEVLALSAAGTATAKLATLTTSRSSQSRLLRRATTQIQKALRAASSHGSTTEVEAAISQYAQIMRARLQISSTVTAQMPIFEEWNQSFQDGIELLRNNNAEELANQLQASRILNAQIPLSFALLSQGKADFDKVKRRVTEFLQEASQIGTQEQVKLAQQLERRWAFQIGDESILDSGFRLEDAETSFTLADEHFRISLQIEPEIAYEGNVLQKTRTFPYLRPSTQPSDLIWYESTPILFNTYSDTNVQTWLTLQDPNETSVSIGFWLLTSTDLTATVTLQILATQALSQDPEGVVIQLAGAQIELPRKPIVAEQREGRGILVYELSVNSRYPEPIRLMVKLA